MVKLIVDKQNVYELKAKQYDEIINDISEILGLSCKDFYLENNGRRLEQCSNIQDHATLYLRLRTLGGKGGFGSMLRAIGAQIEKTTNREACRDLSGRRLRDINEEKRLKSWLEKQLEREREAEERKKRKIEKLLAVPKNDFKDEHYEEARSKLTEKVNDAVEEGFKKALENKKDAQDVASTSNLLKRKSNSQTNPKVKSKKAALWIGDNLSDMDTSDDDSDNEVKAIA